MAAYENLDLLPTMNLRWDERIEEVPGHFHLAMPVKVLQQEWDDGKGNQEWKDIPINKFNT